MAEPRISMKKARDAISPAPIFVLVEPQMGENIGATARAMLNFGVSALRLVAPRDGWPNPKAAAMASGAAFVIDQTRIFDTVDEAIADCQYVVATTARQRELTLPVFSPAEAAVVLRDRIDADQRCAVLFGGERNGLSSDHVARADAIISVPVNPAFASINLSQAALLVAYEWAQATGDVKTVNPLLDEKPANREYVAQFLNQLETALDAAGYFFPEEKRPSRVRNLHTAFSRAGFTEPEIRTLHGVIKALAKPRKNQ
jgi:tRNA/rRNA methyltransferase